MDWLLACLLGWRALNKRKEKENIKTRLKGKQSHLFAAKAYGFVHVQDTIDIF